MALCFTCKTEFTPIIRRMLSVLTFEMLNVLLDNENKLLAKQRKRTLFHMLETISLFRVGFFFIVSECLQGFE